MKKVIARLSLILLIVLVGCAKFQEDNNTGDDDGSYTKTLSDLQIDACNAADSAGTCDTRLAEVGIVLKEDCCEVLGKCC